MSNAPKPNVTAQTAGETAGFGLVTLIAAEALAALFGFPIDAFQVFGAWFLARTGLAWAGFLVGRGIARQKLASSQQFGQQVSNVVNQARQDRGFDG